jgi:predicted nucleic acid-binding protein
MVRLTQFRDPGDEMVLEAAVNGQAAAIVSFNRRGGEAPRPDDKVGSA